MDALTLFDARSTEHSPGVKHTLTTLDKFVLKMMPLTQGRHALTKEQ